jgi:glycine/sarcosine N-methyltransferase
MEGATLDFYDALADHYHLIFEDWGQSIARQATILNALLRSALPRSPLKVLDCACGIGTQAIGFALGGHRVVASDLSPSAVARARREAELRGLTITFAVSDMTSLAEIPEGGFDVVAALDNVFPHLTASQLVQAARAMSAKLNSNGILIASIRDYDRLIEERPIVQGPAFYGTAGNRRIVHQVWDWVDEERYAFHLYITVESNGTWISRHFSSEYRCLLRDELSAVLKGAECREVRWLMPPESGFYQPLVLAKKRDG